MAMDVQRSLDFGNSRRILNLPDPQSPQEPATRSYVDSAIEGLSWKDSCRVATSGNINLAAPGSTIDGLAMASGDRVLVRAQDTAANNGIYIWNGSAAPMTRSLDTSTAAELEQAVTTVEEGTSAGVTFRQTAVNATLGTTALLWVVFGSSVSAATTSSTGTVRLATLAEVDAGVDPSAAVTPDTLKRSVWAAKKAAVNIGDNSATSFTVTHNFGTRDVTVEVYRNSGNYDTVLVETQRASINAVVLLFDNPPASNAFRVVIRA